MSIIDRFGVQMRLARSPVKVDPEMAKDMAVIGYRSQGLTFRQIGLIMNVSHNAIFKRWHAIPMEARRYYAGQTVG